jgi:hypothetical protein
LLEGRQKQCPFCAEFGIIFERLMDRVVAVTDNRLAAAAFFSASALSGISDHENVHREGEAHSALHAGYG